MRFRATAAAAAVALTLSGCATALPSAPPDSSERPAPQSGIRSGLVAIGDGREMFLACRGSGSPTVVFVSGTGGGADEWSTLPSTGAGSPSGSPASEPAVEPVFAAVAESTRVCAYDRPGVTLDDGSPTSSTPVPQPTTARQGVEDLDALLTAADETGPYVLVGASWGGLIVQLFARTHPESTEGLVLVDSASTHLEQSLTAEQWRAWMGAIEGARSGDAESPAYVPTLTEFDSADAPPAVPTVVLSSDRPWDLQVTPGESTWPAWLAAQSELAESLHATHVSDTDSGHGIQVEQPALVTAAVEDVVDEVRSG
ncbi:Pimeloyl-ACP methyl ester carboxylesterase [Agromyces sp. CF514]|uniref:alpha/beta fold hydrolase n=1 Tax=Agromyces sp. CF514 TaxID=1881031 RepID=UPI0008E32DDC|nr:alpha/beta hydrolase [Agromyces sp. CF514]SFR73509.1 Pimeloyl-ACP methyl ester carboxylesterase [Agromyces sp. CF514]